MIPGIVAKGRRAVSSTYRSVILASNPLGYWRLGSAVDLVDETGTYPDGNYYGTPTSATGLLVGDPNTALAFDGVDDRADLGELGTLPGFVSAEALIVAPEGGNSLVILHTHSTGIVYRGLYLSVQPTGRLRMRIGDGGGNTPDDRRDFDTTNALTPGETYWIHARMGGDNNMRIFVGRPGENDFAEWAGTYSGTANTMNTIIGRAYVAFTENFGDTYTAGTVDEVSIYNGVLSEADIEEHYDAASGVL